MARCGVVYFVMAPADAEFGGFNCSIFPASFLVVSLYRTSITSRPPGCARSPPNFPLPRSQTDPGESISSQSSLLREAESSAECIERQVRDGRNVESTRSVPVDAANAVLFIGSPDIQMPELTSNNFQHIIITTAHSVDHEFCRERRSH